MKNYKLSKFKSKNGSKSRDIHLQKSRKNSIINDENSSQEVDDNDDE